MAGRRRRAFVGGRERLRGGRALDGRTHARLARRLHAPEHRAQARRDQRDADQDVDAAKQLGRRMARHEVAIANR